MARAVAPRVKTVTSVVTGALLAVLSLAALLGSTALASQETFPPDQLWALCDGFSAPTGLVTTVARGLPVFNMEVLECYSQADPYQWFGEFGNLRVFEPRLRVRLYAHPSEDNAMAEWDRFPEVRRA